ncbi:MAG: zinc ribbon domain-containing protein, partial [Dehalococcoidia bacterium]
MPVYEFRCPDCGKTFDVLRPREKAGDSAACPDDGSEAIRVFGATFISSPSVDTDFD